MRERFDLPEEDHDVAGDAAAAAAVPQEDPGDAGVAPHDAPRGLRRRGDLEVENCLLFSMCACHPCAGAMLIFSVSLQ